MRASRAENFLGTIGISTAVGAVLGASTLPFYDEPTSHLSNIALGAVVGAVFGLGIWAYGKYIAPSSSHDYAGLRVDFLSEPSRTFQERNLYTNVNAFGSRANNQVIHSRSYESSKTKLDLYTPLVSLSW